MGKRKNRNKNDKSNKTITSSSQGTEVTNYSHHPRQQQQQQNDNHKGIKSATTTFPSKKKQKTNNNKNKKDFSRVDAVVRQEGGPGWRGSGTQPGGRGKGGVGGTGESDSCVGAAAAAAAAGEYPLPFPSHLPRPVDDFLREKNDQEAFQAALRTAYEGFVVDPASKLNYDDDDNDNDQDDDETTTQTQRTVQTALDRMVSAEYFRTDVTQPFGLGTKCAPTYVTRCLVGEYGTTYKYLGLRMFSHPWEDQKTTSCSTSAGSPPTHEIRKLRDLLQKRCQYHLQQLSQTRRKRGGDTTTRGRAAFDICLINRMELSNDLKNEPSFNKAKTTVSWHADSSLEHFSTIAVYQTLVQKQQQQQQKDDTKKSNENNNSCPRYRWSVALRVVHDAEGPLASKKKRPAGTSIESTVVKSSPPIAASLPSGSAYYLLEDFNHHHQHTVLLEEDDDSKKDENGDFNDDDTTTTTIRYSCTYRLLRESHNVSYMLERCRTAVSQFHKKGMKLWRSEQLLLFDVESEWIRQFFIQGTHHRDLLWQSWGEPIQQLLKFWSKLEERTDQIIELLRGAAKGQCGFFEETEEKNQKTSLQPTPTRAQRKARERAKKALATMKELVGRAATSGGTSSASARDGGIAQTTIYEPFAVLLEERSTMRELWMKREKDHVFREMSPDQRPVPVPFLFSTPSNINNNNNDDNDNKNGAKKQASNDSGNNSGNNNNNSKAEEFVVATSPLPGSPSDLRKVASNLREYGRAYASGKIRDLPLEEAEEEQETKKVSTIAVSSTSAGEQPASSLTAVNSCMPLKWSGWSQHTFGLELQAPFAQAVVEGRKTIETRLYDFPPALLGKRIYIIETPKGSAGVSAMGDIINFNDSNNMNDSSALATNRGDDDNCGRAKLIGWCTIELVKKYTSCKQFEKDESLHLVDKNSGYGWKKGKTTCVFGWVIGKCQPIDAAAAFASADPNLRNDDGRGNHFTSAVRRMRSLFQLIHGGENNDKIKLNNNSSKSNHDDCANPSRQQQHSRSNNKNKNKTSNKKNNKKNRSSNGNHEKSKKRQKQN